MEHSFHERLRDWVDWDCAEYWLAISLGLMNHESGLCAGPAKHVFRSDNPIGNMLGAMLDEMAAAGILETRNEPGKQFRWNPAFRGTWEPAE